MRTIVVVPRRLVNRPPTWAKIRIDTPTGSIQMPLRAGVSAWRQGKLAEFYSSREARAAGDPDWAALYAFADESQTTTDAAPQPVTGPGT